MAHLTAIIDQITRMENSLVNILLETAVKLSTLTDANIFVMVDTAGGRKWAGRKSLRDEYVRGMLKPSSKDVEVTEAISSVPQEEFSVGHLMGMAAGGLGSQQPLPPSAPSVPVFGQAVFPTAQQHSHQQQQQRDGEPGAAKRPRLSVSADVSSTPTSNASSASASKIVVNNNVATSPPHVRRKSPNREPQPVILEANLSPINPSTPPATTTTNRETKNLKDEFNGDERVDDDSIVIKEELGRGRGDDSRGYDDDEEELEASLDDAGGGVTGWGEVALAGPSGLQQNSDANQPVLDVCPVEPDEMRSADIFVTSIDSVEPREDEEEEEDEEERQEEKREVAEGRGDGVEMVKGEPNFFRRGKSIGGNFNCSTCGKSFPNSRNLRRHIANVHLKQSSFRCDHCGKGFMDRTNYADHVARHEGVSRYVCHLCARDFISKGVLKTHLFTCTGRPIASRSHAHCSRTAKTDAGTPEPEMGGDGDALIGDAMSGALQRGGAGQNVTLEPAILIGGGADLHVGQMIEANLTDEDMYHNFGSTIARVMDLSSL